jgi:YVTN family beta-propeller protein
MKMNNLFMRSAPLAVRLVTICSLLPAIPSSTHAVYAATPTPSHEFRIQNQWNLGGTGGWGLLALDASAHQLYIPRSNRVMIVDTRNGTLLGEVGGMKNVREMVLDDTGKYGYVTDPTDGSVGFVRVFDRATRQLVTSVPTGRVPAAIAFEPITKSVFAFNSHDHSVTVIDGTTNLVTATILLAGRPAAAVADGAGNVFVTLPALGEITRIDAVQKKVITSWSLGACNGPAGLAIDSAQRQFFTTCEDHKVVSVDANNGHVTAIGDAAPGSGDIDFDPKHNMLFLADTTGVLTIFHRTPSGKYSMVQQVKTQPGARTMIVSHDEGKAFLVASKFGMNTTTTSEELQLRPTPVPGTFAVIVIGR